MKKYLILIFCILIVFFASAQTYNPNNAQLFNKPFGSAQAIPTDARSFFYDATNFLWRPYQNTTEVLTFLSNAVPKYRVGNFIIVVDSGGTLQPNGSYVGGVNTFWMFRDGTADVNLVELNLFGTGGGGSGTVTNVSATNGSGLTFTITNPTTTPNISVVTASGGDVSGPLNNIVVNKFNSQPPSYYLNYLNLFNTPVVPPQFNPIAGTGITITGAYPNMTFSSTGGGGGFNTAGVDLIALSASTVALDTLNYRKVDTLTSPNDSTLIFVLNGVSHTIQMRGGTHGSGPGAGTVTNFSFVNANGVSGAVSNPTSIPALTITLGAIVPSSVNGLTLTALATGFTIQGGTTSKTLTVPLDATVSGTNTGDVTLAGETYLSRSGQVITANPVNLSGTNVTGTLAAARFGALTGDVTNSSGSYATTISNNVVTNAKLAQMNTLTIKGNNTGGTANAADLTVAQVNAILPVFTTTLNGLVPAPGSATGKVLSDGGTWVTNGTGNTNTNVGSAYRWAIPGTNQIKTYAAGYGLLNDSATSNTITTKVDTSIIQAKGLDTIYVKNVPTGGTGLGLSYAAGDTIYIKKLVAGANITLTQNSDSSITITSSGGGGGGITTVGAYGSQPPSTDGAVISGSSIYFQSEDATHNGMLSTVAQVIAGAKTFSSAPTFTTLTTNGGIFYGNGTGVLQQSGAGTSTQVLHGGTAPSYGAVTLTTDVSGILPIANGGTGSNAPALIAGTGITITGSWPNNTITAINNGTVTSINVSGASTGFTFTGGPVTSSGIITLTGTLVPSNGGTGLSSLTPYAVVAGGATATGTLQQVSGLGTLGQVLTSQGAGQLPTWTTISGGGGLALDAVQSYTSGATVTVSNGNNYIFINPASVVSALTITLPSTWHNSNNLIIIFGGTITSGNPVITSLTIAGGAGQTLVQAVAPSGTFYSGEAIQYKLNGSLDYRVL